MRKFLLLAACSFFISYPMIAGEPYQLKNELTVRWGVVDGENWNNSDWDWYWNYGWDTPLDRYNSGKYYRDEKECTQAISISYTRELKKWLAISIVGAYSGVRQNERERRTYDIVGRYRKHRIAVMPMVRFTYLNRPVVRLYSAVGFGFGTTKEHWTYEHRHKTNDTYIQGQATFFGVSVEKKWFALTELGVGAMGIFTIGTGYRF